MDANSNVYITGGTNFQHTGSATTDFPILNAYQGCLDTPPPLTPPTTTPNCSTSVTATDAFVAKLNPAAAAGAQLLYSTYLGGTGNDVGYGIAVDSGLERLCHRLNLFDGFHPIPAAPRAFQGTEQRPVELWTPSSASLGTRAPAPPAPPRPYL